MIQSSEPDRSKGHHDGRTIQRMVLNQLSKDILAQKVDREHPIVIDRKDDELVFVNK